MVVHFFSWELNLSIRRKFSGREKSVKIAQNSINEGVYISVTAKITNLPIHEVEAIAERLGKKTA